MEKNWNKEIELDELVVDRYEGEKAARLYLAENRRKAERKKKIASVMIATVSTLMLTVVFSYASCGKKEVPAKPTETTVETTTESTEEITTEVVKVDKECIVRNVVGATITVECNGELYDFYGDGYAKGQKVVCTFENEKITDASEPIIEEPETEIKFFDVPLSEEIQLHIFAECKKYNISPALVIAIIERESTYDASRVGDNGKSFGIMQIQPEWHSHRVTELGYTDFDWFNPKQNISVGCHFLNELFGKYGDDLYTVLMGYNGSPSYVKKMTSQGLVSDYAKEVSARAEELENAY